MYRAMLLLALWGCGDAAGPGGAIRDVDVREAATLLARDKEIVVLDIRTPQEFARGHIAGARNIDYRGAGFRAALEKLDRGKPYLMHCASGGRSTRSLAVFAELGFEKVYHLKAGMNGWAAAGQPVSRRP